MSEETVLKLKQYELENEIELQKLQLENNKLDLESYILNLPNFKNATLIK